MPEVESVLGKRGAGQDHVLSDAIICSSEEGREGHKKQRGDEGEESEGDTGETERKEATGKGAAGKLTGAEDGARQEE